MNDYSKPSPTAKALACFDLSSSAFTSRFLTFLLDAGDCVCLYRLICNIVAVQQLCTGTAADSRQFICITLQMSLCVNAFTVCSVSLSNAYRNVDWKKLFEDVYIGFTAKVY